MWVAELPVRRERLADYTHTNLNELPSRLRALVQWTSDTRNRFIDAPGHEAARWELEKLRPAMHEIEWVDVWLGWAADRKAERSRAA